MSTAVQEPTTTDVVQDVGRARPAHRPIPMGRLLRVELTKMFDTRSGFWLLASIGIAATLATGAVIAFAPEEEQTYSAFASAIGMPMAVILPMIAILSVTSEWSQRSGLTTFTLVPHRGRVVLAKALCAIGVGVASMVVALSIGAIGNVVGTAISGAPTTWDTNLLQVLYIVLASVLGMMVGFTLGVLIRNSPGAIVGYFVYSFVVPTLSMMLAAFQDWYADLQPWVDFNYTQTMLYDNDMTGEMWTQLAVSSVPWLVLPLAVGTAMLLRSEVK